MATTLLQHFRSELVDRELARDPRAEVDGVHPLWLEPRNGAIAPGEVENAIEDDDELVMSAYKLPGVVTPRHEGSYFRWDNVQLVFRAHRPPEVYELEAQLRPILNDRRDWTLGSIDGGLRVIESLIFAELGPIGATEVGGFAFRIEYAFQTYTPEPAP